MSKCTGNKTLKKLAEIYSFIRKIKQAVVLGLRILYFRKHNVDELPQDFCSDGNRSRFQNIKFFSETLNEVSEPNIVMCNTSSIQN
jgi:hypothetical protein